MLLPGHPQFSNIHLPNESLVFGLGMKALEFNLCIVDMVSGRDPSTHRVTRATTPSCQNQNQVNCQVIRQPHGGDERHDSCTPDTCPSQELRWPITPFIQWDHPLKSGLAKRDRQIRSSSNHSQILQPHCCTSQHVCTSCHPPDPSGSRVKPALHASKTPNPLTRL